MLTAVRIVHEPPPLFDEIDAAFKVAGQPVIFAWGHRIYNPERIEIPPQLISHEAVHGHRQGRDIEGWWRRYIDEPAFRLAEEIPAHQAEYLAMVELAINRNERRRALKTVAKRMAGPLYGALITASQARATLAGHMRNTT